MTYGLDGMVISDHDMTLPRDEQNQLQEQYPDFRIFRGCEISVQNSHAHINVIGGELPTIPTVSNQNVTGWGARIAEAGAVTVLNHPFWRGEDIGIDLDRYCPDCVELLSLLAPYDERVLRLAKERDMLLVAGSDAHTRVQIGAYYIDTDQRVDTDEELVKELLAGRFRLAASEARVAEVSSEERIAAEVHREGGTLEDYHRKGGKHPVFYNGVIDGTSYLPSTPCLPRG